MPDQCLWLTEDETVEKALAYQVLPSPLHVAYCQIGDLVANVQTSTVTIGGACFVLPGRACSASSIHGKIGLVICANLYLVAFDQTGIICRECVGVPYDESSDPVLFCNQTASVFGVLFHCSDVLVFQLTEGSSNDQSKQVHFNLLSASRIPGATAISILSGEAVYLGTENDSMSSLWILSQGEICRIRVEELPLDYQVPMNSRRLIGQLPLKMQPKKVLSFCEGGFGGVILVGETTIVVATLNNIISGNADFAELNTPPLFAVSLLRSSDGSMQVFILNAEGLFTLGLGRLWTNSASLHKIAELPKELLLPNQPSIIDCHVQVSAGDKMQLFVCDSSNISKVFDLTASSHSEDAFFKENTLLREGSSVISKLSYDKRSGEILGLSVDPPRAYILKHGIPASPSTFSSISISGTRHASFLERRSLLFLSDGCTTSCFQMSFGDSPGKYSLVEIGNTQFKNKSVLCCMEVGVRHIIATHDTISLCLSSPSGFSVIKEEPINLLTAEANRYLLCGCTTDGVILVYQDMAIKLLELGTRPLFCRLTPSNHLLVSCVNQELLVYKVNLMFEVTLLATVSLHSLPYDAYLSHDKKHLVVSFNTGAWWSFQLNSCQLPQILSTPEFWGFSSAPLRFCSYALQIGSGVYATSVGMHYLDTNSGTLSPLLSNEGSLNSLEQSIIEDTFSIQRFGHEEIFAVSATRIFALNIPTEFTDLKPAPLIFELNLMQNKDGCIIDAVTISCARCWVVARTGALDFFDLKTRQPLNWHIKVPTHSDHFTEIVAICRWKFCYESDSYEHLVVAERTLNQVDIRTYSIQRNVSTLILCQRLRIGLAAVTCLFPHENEILVLGDTVPMKLGIKKVNSRVNFTVSAVGDLRDIYGQELKGIGIVSIASNMLVSTTNGLVLLDNDRMEVSWRTPSYTSSTCGVYSWVRCCSIQGQKAVVTAENQTLLRMFIISSSTSLNVTVSEVFQSNFYQPVVDLQQISDSGGVAQFLLVMNDGSMRMLILIPKVRALTDDTLIKFCAVDSEPRHNDMDLHFGFMRSSP